MQVKAALDWAYQVLSKAQQEEPGHEPVVPATPMLDAQWLLMRLLGWERHHLITRDTDPLDPQLWDQYQAWIFRRLKGEPVAYIIEEKPFMGLSFRVVPGVLIPRPDTELLVETVLSRLKGPVKVAEIGTGSGAVIISILHTLEDAWGVGLEISEKAIEITEENAYSNHVHKRLEVRKSDCFSGVLPGERFDGLVSNPPYISKADMAKLMRDVGAFEPHLALYGGEDGLDFYRRITLEAPEYLVPGGYLFFEIGYDQAEAVLALMAERGFEDNVLLRDLANHPRVVFGRWPGSLIEES